MTVEIQEANPNDAHSAEMAEPLPFPFNQRTYCNYEPIEKSIEQARVLIVDNLLRDEGDLSQVAREEWGKLTDDDWDRVGGNFDQFVGKIQEKYGWERNEAEKRANEWADRHAKSHDMHQK